MMELSKETLLGLLRALLGGESESSGPGGWKVGAAYLIRTVTNYWTGRLVAIGEQELVLADAAWIADTGRFTQALDKADLNEVEPVKGNVIIGRGSIVDAAEWKNNLPREQK